MYLCIFCNYYNEKKENYIRHVKTKKHLDIVKKILDVPHNNYICGICKYKTDKKSSYFCHINLCLIKNFNNTFQTDYKAEITQLKNTFKTEKKNLQLTINKLKKKNIFFMKIFQKLIEEDYINERVLNNKNIFSFNEKNKIVEYLRTRFKNNEEKILNDIKNQSNNITTIYLNNKYEKDDIQQVEKITNVKNIYSGTETETESESESETESETETESFSESDSGTDIDLDDNVNNLKKIRDCGRLYFYNNENIVFNINNERIGIRVHDEYCPKTHVNNKYNENCWWYVQYDKNKIEDNL